MTPVEIYNANLGNSHEAAIGAVYSAGQLDCHVLVDCSAIETELATTQSELEALKTKTMSDVEGRN